MRTHDWLRLVLSAREVIKKGYPIITFDRYDANSTLVFGVFYSLFFLKHCYQGLFQMIQLVGAVFVFIVGMSISNQIVVFFIF